jgi:DNA-binding ferritin-like protein
MTRHQKIELITERLEHLDGEALEGLVKLLKHTSVTKKSSSKQRLEQSTNDMDEESRAWLEADLTPALPPYA